MKRRWFETQIPIYNGIDLYATPGKLVRFTATEMAKLSTKPNAVHLDVPLALDFLVEEGALLPLSNVAVVRRVRMYIESTDDLIEATGFDPHEVYRCLRVLSQEIEI